MLKSQLMIAFYTAIKYNRPQKASKISNNNEGEGRGGEERALDK